MKIEHVITRPVTVPMLEPIRWSFGVREKASALVVEVQTDEGIEGLGEITGPLTPLAVQGVIENHLAPLVIGEDPFGVERITKKLQAAGMLWCPDLSFITAGIEMALWDIMGKALNEPVHRLLGGLYRKEIEFCGYLFIKDPEDMAKDALRFVRSKYSSLKIKVGLGPTQDIEMVRVVREAVGDDIEIRIDANQAWSLPTAIGLMKKMEKFDLQFIEQPLRRDDIRGMARLRRSAGIPLAVNEGAYTSQDILRIVREEAADVIVTDMRVCGGMLECRKVCAIAEAAGIPAVMHSGCELGIGTAAMIHLVACIPSFIYSTDTHYSYLADDIIEEEFRIRNAKVSIPEEPGLGVTLNTEKVKEYQEKGVYSPFFDASRPAWVPTAPMF